MAPNPAHILIARSIQKSHTSNLNLFEIKIIKNIVVAYNLKNIE